MSILPLVCLRNLGQKLRIVAKSVRLLGAIAGSQDDLHGFELDAHLAARIPELLRSGCEFDFGVPEGVSGINVVLQEVPTLASSDLVIGHNGDPGQFLAFEGHHNLSGAGAEQVVLAHQRVPSGLDNVCEGNTAVVVQLPKELGLRLLQVDGEFESPLSGSLPPKKDGFSNLLVTSKPNGA